jgi:hypothetical protein
MEGNAYFKVLSQISAGWSEENHENISQDNRCMDQDSDSELLECKTGI